MAESGPIPGLETAEPEAVIHLPDGTDLPAALVRACCPFVGQPLWDPCSYGERCRPGDQCRRVAEDETRHLLVDLAAAGFRVVPSQP